MRRFALALDGRVSRRSIALSPHVWSATGVMFGIYAVAVLVIAVAFGTFEHARLFALGGTLAAIAVAFVVTRPAEPNTLGTHVALATAYLGSAASVAAFSPEGSATVISGLLTAPLISIWMIERRAIIGHLVAASAALLAAAVLGGGDHGTFFAVATFIPAMWVLTACCVVVLSAVEAQGREYERLAMRDPLTGVGNAEFVREELDLELARHRGASHPLTVLELELTDFAQINSVLGRSAGDGVLAMVAAVLAAVAQPGASVARPAGNRFTMLLPATTRADADRLAERIRQQLALIDTGGVVLGTRVATASFPADGDHREALLTVAAERLRRADPQHRTAAPAGPMIGGLAVQVGDVPPLPTAVTAGTPSPEAREDWAATLVDRAGIALDRLVWRVTGLTIVGYAVITGAALVVDPAFVTPAVVGVAATTFIVGVAVLALRPPPITAWQNHLVVALSWGLPIAAMAALAPHASVGTGTALFGGALIATRLTNRRHILTHLTVFSAMVWALMLSGSVDLASILAGLTLILSTWVLVGCYTVVFEAAEAQGRRMADLVLRDPLTGAGNERLLRERLADELPRHRDMQMPLVIIDLQLSGWAALRTHEGRGAADSVLRDVAVLLGSATRGPATISRIQDDRFRMLLPLTGPEDADALIRDLRIAVAGTSRRGRMILARIGSAAFPEDGVTDEALDAIAEARMEADDPREHDLLGTPDPDEHLPLRQIVERRTRATDHHGAERRRSAG